MSDIGKVQAKFTKHLHMLLLSIRGKANFLQFTRYGIMNEKSDRNNFENTLDWSGFNCEFVSLNCSDELIIGFDRSFISKNGKKTPEIGYYYSGCKGRIDRGLERGCFSVFALLSPQSIHPFTPANSL